MAAHSSILAWRIPWTEEPGGLKSIGSHRVEQTEATEHTHANAGEISKTELIEIAIREFEKPEIICKNRTTSDLKIFKDKKYLYSLCFQKAKEMKNPVK